MTPTKTDYIDRTEYRLNGELHREDGPAVIKKDGGEDWCLHGKYHREDGPAQIWREETKSRYLHKKWYIEGNELTEKEVETAIKILSGEYPFENLPLLINHPTLKYFAKRKLGGDTTWIK